MANAWISNSNDSKVSALLLFLKLAVFLCLKFLVICQDYGVWHQELQKSQNNGIKSMEMTGLSFTKHFSLPLIHKNKEHSLIFLISAAGV
jgi:hypothetical protein